VEPALKASRSGYISPAMAAPMNANAPNVSPKAVKVRQSIMIAPMADDLRLPRKVAPIWPLDQRQQLDTRYGEPPTQQVAEYCKLVERPRSGGAGPRWSPALAAQQPRAGQARCRWGVQCMADWLASPLLAISFSLPNSPIGVLHWEQLTT
jgi:hypothetical protein